MFTIKNNLKIPSCQTVGCQAQKTQGTSAYERPFWKTNRALTLVARLFVLFLWQLVTVTLYKKNIYHKFGSQQSSVNNGYILREKDLNSFRLIWLETFGSVVGFKDCVNRDSEEKTPKCKITGQLLLALTSPVSNLNLLVVRNHSRVSRD